MEKKRMISDAAKELGVESHVLRYWEEELELSIPRNEMGHRYYGDKEMKLLMEVKAQKKKGAQLKEIKDRLPALAMPLEPKEIPQKVEIEETNVIPFPNEQSRKMEQFQDIMVKIVGQAIKNHEEDLSRRMGQQVADRVAKEMDYHFRQQEQMEEKRYQQFDEMVRGYQRARAEAAIASEGRRRRFFGRKRKR
jgi:DNA-binding transcriptional MerR regulator